MTNTPVHSASMRKRKAAGPKAGHSRLGGMNPAPLPERLSHHVSRYVAEGYDTVALACFLPNNLPRRLIPSRLFQPAHDLGAYGSDALEVLRDRACAMSVGMGQLPAFQVDDVAHVSLLRSSSDSRERKRRSSECLKKDFANWQAA